MPNTPGTVLFPGALDDQDSLFQVANNATTTLNGSIGAGDLSITVTSGALLPSTGAITLVDSITSAPTKIEHIYYTANSSNVLTVPSGGRGADGSTAQSWSGTVYVRARVLASHHTAIRNAVIAVETKLGTSSSTPSAGKVLRATGTGTSAWGAVVDADISSSAAITLSKLAAVTASRALVSDVSGVVSASAVTATELGYLSGVTSAIQTQLDTKGNAQTANPLSQFAATTSAQLAGVISDETGSGALVFATSPTLTTPVLGVATATSINKVAFTAPATGATLTLADGSTLATSGANSITFTSTGATSVTLPTSGTLVNSAVTSLSSLTTVGTITSGGLGTGAVLGGVTMTLGTDATGDIYYRNSGGVLTRLAIGSSGNVLTVSGGLPAWGSAGGGTAGNPTASVGLSAVNGVASTYMRSDAAPALDQTIAPTWTGRHTFASTSTTGTGATAGSVFTYNSLTTGDGLSVSSSSATSGNLVKITSTSTAAASSTLTGLNIAMSGANGTTAQTVTGASISVTNTNATSGTNVGLTLTASGATTNNEAIKITAGRLNWTAAGAFNTQQLVFSGSSPVLSLYVDSSAQMVFRDESSGGNLVIEPNSARRQVYIAADESYGFSNSNNSSSGSVDWSILRVAANTARITSGGAGTSNHTGAGNLILGTSAGAIGTSGKGVLAFTLSTAPSTSPTDTVQVYSNDAAAGDHNLYARTEAGQINRLTGLAAVVSSQFDKTSSTTLADVTGLTRNVEAGRTYAFTAVLYTTSNVAGGVKAAISGTATATSIVYEAEVKDGSTFATMGTSRATALGTTVGDVTAVTAARITITGTIVVNAAGTLTVQFAQNASNGTASSVLVNSSFNLVPIT